MTLVQTLGEKLQAKRLDAHNFLASFKKDGEIKMTQADIDSLSAKRAELTDLQTQFDTALFDEQNSKGLSDFNKPVNNVPVRSNDGFTAQKSIGELFAEKYAPVLKDGSYDPKSTGSKQFSIPGLSMKTLVTTSAGFSAPNNRTGIVVDSAQRVPVVANLIPQIETDLTSIRYMVESTYTDAAAARAEGGTFAESALAFTETNALVQSIAHSIPVTEEQLMDVPQIQSILNDRMVLMLEQKEETELLSGTGTGNRITGFLQTSGINTYAKAGGDSAFDAFLKAYTLVRTSGSANAWGSSNVTGVILNPTDAQNMMLLRTADGLYIMGNPSGDNPLRIWGITPTITNAIAAGTSLVGDFRSYAQIYRNLGINVEVGLVNDQFIKGIKTIRAWERLALAVLRPAAFSTVTNL